MKLISKIVSIAVTTGMMGFAVIAQADGQRNAKQNDCGPHDRKAGFEGGDGGLRHMHKYRMRADFAEVLELTDAQKKTLEAARSAQDVNFKDSHKKLRAAHRALDEAGDTNADDGTLTQLSNELATLIAQREIARIKMHRELVSILTAEQQKKLDDLEAERKGPGRWNNKRHTPTTN
jgi:Spy/CpxP family protein refolding chaperone